MSGGLVAAPQELDITDAGPQADDGTMATIRRGLSLSPELRVGLGVTLLLALVSTAGRVVVPLVVQQILDVGLGGADSSAVDLEVTTRLIVLGSVAVLITAVATGIMNYRLALVSERALSNLRRRTFAHIHDLSMLHQAAEQRGVLVARVTTDIDQISRFMQWAGLQLIVNTGQATLALIAMLVLSWQLALVVLLSVPIISLVIRAFQRRLDTAYRLVRIRVGRLLGLLAETVVGAQVIRAYGAEQRSRDRLDDAIEEHRTAALRAGWLSAGFSGAGEMLSALVLTSVMIAGAVLVTTDVTSVGRVVALLFLAQLFVEPVQSFGEAVNEAQGAVAGWRRVIEVLDLPTDVADPGVGGTALPAGPLGVRLHDVDFAYPTGAPVLHSVGLTVPPQQNVAVVGETGSGKTTFAKLVARLMDPTRGTVEIGEVALEEVPFSSLRRRVVMVPQEGALFTGTITHNVRVGGRGDVNKAFEDLGLREWIDSLPDGLATEVGERGDALSAGERQLVALARAYVADPDVLILDEATSAVDPVTEQRLQRALAGLTRGRTTITIAHRLSTAEHADRVLVFDAGRIVQDGPHDALVDAEGPYRNLHDAWRSGTRT